MRGIVRSVEFGFGFIAGQDGEMYFSSAQFMPMDELGRRYLMPGEEVEFKPAKSIDGRHKQANEIKLVTTREPVEGYYQEEGRVTNVGGVGEYCFVERPFGGVAFLHYRRVVSCKLRDSENRPMFEPGQVFAFEIVKPKDISRPWLASKAREL